MYAFQEFFLKSGSKERGPLCFDEGGGGGGGGGSQCTLILYKWYCESLIPKKKKTNLN